MTDLRFDKRILVLGVIVSMIIPFQAASAEHETVPIGVYAVDLNDRIAYFLDFEGNVLEEDEDNFDFDANGGVGLAIDPATSSPPIFYGSFLVDSDDNFLATVDPEISNQLLLVVSIDPFSGGETIGPLAFHSDGTLYGVDEDGILYTISLDGSTTEECSALGFGAISFDEADLLYIILGGSTPELLTVDLGTCDTTSVALLGGIPSPVTSLTYSGKSFRASTDNGEFHSITEAGETNEINSGLPTYGGIAIFTDGTNEAPVAVLDSANTDEDVPLSVADPGVLGNDSDREFDYITAVLDTSTTNGVLILQSTGGYDYTPNDDFFGDDTFTYHADDGDPSNIVTVTITVNPIPDPPTAFDDMGATDADAVLNVVAPGVLGNDDDPDLPDDELKVDSNTSPSTEGATVTVNSDGSYTYDPTTSTSLCTSGDPTELDTFDYTMSDLVGAQDTATVKITVTCGEQNNLPIANDDEYTRNNGGKLVVNSVEGILSNDEDADGDDLTAILQDDVSNGNLMLNSDGSFTYKPDPTFVGTDTFTYVAFDGLEESNVATVQINVTFCGRDNFENVILGTKKNDHLWGTNLNDVIRGFAGNDKIDGKDGDDCIFGGKGNDKIEGGDGDDTIFGRAGNDYISGGDGNDIIKGGKGKDKINGGDGDDEIFGGKGKDKINGGDGDDTIKGGQGKDVIKGGDGNDDLFGNKGNDKLFGEKGNDHLNGGKGKDHCVGGKGENTFVNCEKIKDDNKKGHDKHDDKKGHDKHDDKKGHDKHDNKKGHDKHDNKKGHDKHDNKKGH